MKSREEAVQFVELQLSATYQSSRPKGIAFHYGRQELRELLDFIYEGPPIHEEEKVKKANRK